MRPRGDVGRSGILLLQPLAQEMDDLARGILSVTSMAETSIYVR